MQTDSTEIVENQAFFGASSTNILENQAKSRKFGIFRQTAFLDANSIEILEIWAYLGADRTEILEIWFLVQTPQNPGNLSTLRCRWHKILENQALSEQTVRVTDVTLPNFRQVRNCFGINYCIDSQDKIPQELILTIWALQTYTPPPPSPISGQKAFSQGRGVGVYISRPHAAGILYAPPLLYTPHP